MKKIFLSLITASLSQIACSQEKDSTKKIPATISGSLDIYYRHNMNKPKQYPYNSLTSFTHSSQSFEIGMASLRVDHSLGRVRATVDLGFGSRAEEFAYHDAGTRLAIKQLYLSYAASSILKLTAGTWATHLGYEQLDAWLNRNYSMSYMFTHGPFSHTGLKAEIGLGGKQAIMVGISNPTDQRTAPALPKSFIAQFSAGTADDKLKGYLNFVDGRQNDSQRLVQGDIVVSYSASAKFSLAFNGTWQSVQPLRDSADNSNTRQWQGAALYINFDPATWLGVSLWTEYIRDNDRYLGLKSVVAPTISLNFRTDNLTLIPEFRFDRAGNAVFYKNATETTNASSSFLLAATYHF